MEPLPAVGHGAINGITMAGDQPLAVGFHLSQSGRTRHPLALLRRGGTWRSLDVAVGDGIGPHTLNDVDAVTARNVWAVGGARAPTGRGHVPLVMHWNGIRWTRPTVPLPDGHGHLTAVDARLGDVWAVGIGFGGAFVIHRVSGDWEFSLIPPPDGASGGLPSDIAAAAADDVWVAGHVYAADDFRSWAAHWNGTAWTSFLPEASPDSRSGHLRAIAIAADRSLVAVGIEEVDGRFQSLVQVGTSDDANWTGRSPEGQQNLILHAAAFAPGSNAASFLVGSGPQGEPVAFWDCF
jgi:hypothetical protein